MKLNNVKVGDKFQFVYTGGSHPNSIRTVTVSEVTSNTINGFDEYVDEYRSFLKDKIRFFQSIEPKGKLCVSIEKYGDDYFIDFILDNQQVSFRVNQATEKIYDENDNQLNSFDDIIDKF